MNVLNVVILATIFISVVFDAYRDSWIHRNPNIGWAQWHLVKWISFFSPLVLLSYFYFVAGGFTVVTVVVLVAFIIICYLVWRFIYNSATKQP